MNEHETNARNFAAKLVLLRRAAVKEGLTSSSGIDLDLLRRLEAFNRAVALMDEIQADEQLRSDGEASSPGTLSP